MSAGLPDHAMLVGAGERADHALREGLASLAGGTGPGLVLIGGGMGLGKGLRLPALTREAADSGVFVCRGHCYTTTDTPVWPCGRDLFGIGLAPGGAASPAPATARQHGGLVRARGTGPPSFRARRMGAGAILAIFAQVRGLTDECGRPAALSATR